MVADSSPLIVLSKIGCFDLLPKLCPSVFITPEVYGEVVIAGINQPGATQVAKADWIEVKPIMDSDRLSAAQIETGLGAGEISTILLAKEIRADLALIDDLPARKFATREGIDVRGSVGIIERSLPGTNCSISGTPFCKSFK